MHLWQLSIVIHNIFILYQKQFFFNYIKFLIIFYFYIIAKKKYIYIYFFNGTKDSITFHFYIIPKQYFFNSTKYSIIFCFYIIPKKIFFLFFKSLISHYSVSQFHTSFHFHFLNCLLSFILIFLFQNCNKFFIAYIHVN